MVVKYAFVRDLSWDMPGTKNIIIRLS